jgi:DNA-binding NarL/FixJ family response regulator
MIRIFLADDHPVVRHGIARLLEEHRDLKVVGQASHGRQVLQAEGKDGWDLLLLDLSLPRVNGLEVLRRMRVEAPNVRVIILSALPEAHYGPRVLEEGAAAFLSKSAAPVDIIRTIRAVARGDYVATAPTAAQPADGREKAPHERLSAREYQVFMLIVEGRSSSEIAAELNIVPSTVSNHLAKVKERLGASSIADIVTYAHRVGLATAAPNAS